MRMLQEEPEEMKEEMPENKDAIRKSKDYQPDTIREDVIIQGINTIWNEEGTTAGKKVKPDQWLPNII